MRSSPASLVPEPHPGPVRLPVPPGCPPLAVFPLGSGGSYSQMCRHLISHPPGAWEGSPCPSCPSSAGSSPTPGPASLTGWQDCRGWHGDANAHQEGASGARQPTCRGLCPVLELVCECEHAWDPTRVWAWLRVPTPTRGPRAVGTPPRRDGRAAPSFRVHPQPSPPRLQSGPPKARHTASPPWNQTLVARGRPSVTGPHLVLLYRGPWSAPQPPASPGVLWGTPDSCPPGHTVCTRHVRGPQPGPKGVRHPTSSLHGRGRVTRLSGPRLLICV